MNFRVISTATIGFAVGEVVMVGVADREAPFPYPVQSLDTGHKDFFSDYGYEKSTREPTREELDTLALKLEATVEALRKPLPPSYKVGDPLYRVNSGHCSTPARCDAILPDGLVVVSRAVGPLSCARNCTVVNDRYYWIGKADGYQNTPNRR